MDAVVGALTAMAVTDSPEHLPSAGHVAEELALSHIDLAVDSVLGFDAAGVLVAYGLVALDPGADTRAQSYLSGGVIPEARGRGIGRELLRWQLERSRQQLATVTADVPGWSMLFCPEGNASAPALFARVGAPLTRYFVGMHRDVAKPIDRVEPRAAEDGLRIVPFEPALADSARRSRNDSFRDHWGSQPTLPEEWSVMVDAPAFRYDLSRVAVVGEGDDRRVVGFGLVELNEQDWEAQGYTSAYIDYIGVSREARGRRVAPAIIGEVLTAIRDAGYQQALLDVDSASPTGADELYGRWGFVAGTRELAFVREY
ncbi:hypothetical protein FM119_00470 [Mycetocola reblochoni REB411]|uniref:N-acetyltransferase domain-containing protein n=1 Tax=Mycetocola reblochoni REB411 TaxID=1255698 RepID=A0A1R4I9F2_9MICO|nr:hypothetical protein FM119_00470 [Mycetocola reblochoni REB411]